MKMLSLKDLEFTYLDYKEYGDGLRDWLVSSMNYHPASLKWVSDNYEIGYRSLLDFTHGKLKYMNYRNMNNLRDYINSIIDIREEHGTDIVNIKEDETQNLA